MVVLKGFLMFWARRRTLVESEVVKEIRVACNVITMDGTSDQCRMKNTLIRSNRLDG